MTRLRRALRLIVITDPALARPRSLDEVVAAALEGGARTIQLRDKAAPARELTERARRLRAATTEAGALLFVNDRLDVALAAEADGVHLGPDDLPLGAARRAAPAGFLIGYSTDDPEEARRAQRLGADYIGCGAVFGSRTKEVGEEAIGPDRLDEVARAVDIPVVGIGGIDVTNVRRIAATAACGSAVVSAVMAAADPAQAVRALLAPWSEARDRSA